VKYEREEDWDKLMKNGKLEDQNKSHRRATIMTKGQAATTTINLWRWSKRARMTAVLGVWQSVTSSHAEAQNNSRAKDSPVA
jgi:hypothetical protein